MGKQEAVSAAVDAETLADLGRLAEHMNCSVDHLVTTAVLRFVDDEIGAITPDGFAHLPPYRNPSPTGRAVAQAEAKAHEALLAFLKEGEDDIARGDVVSHEEVMAELKQLDDRALAERQALAKRRTSAKKQAA